MLLVSLKHVILRIAMKCEQNKKNGFNDKILHKKVPYIFLLTPLKYNYIILDFITVANFIQMQQIERKYVCIKPNSKTKDKKMTI